MTGPLCTAFEASAIEMDAFKRAAPAEFVTEALGLVCTHGILYAKVVDGM